MRVQNLLCGFLVVLFVTAHSQEPSAVPPKNPADKPATKKMKPPPGNLPAGDMSVKRAVIALEVVDREPKDPGTEFPSDIKRLYCFTEIIGGEGQEIQHRWFWKDTKISTVSLGVKYNRHRTYSSKSIAPDMVGQWRVEIVNTGNDAVLEAVQFTIK